MRLASLQPHRVLFGSMLANGQHEIVAAIARAFASAHCRFAGPSACSILFILSLGFATPKFGKKVLALVSI
jgi:hypothetical protein